MNKPQSSTAQQSEQATKTQTKPKILKPDFSHRIPEHMQEATPLNLSDAVDQSALQAISVLNMLASHFTGDTDGISDETIFWSIESVIKTIQDIKATVTAYHELNKAVSHE